MYVATARRILTDSRICRGSHIRYHCSKAPPKNYVQEFWSLRSPCHFIFADHGRVGALDCHFIQDPVASLGTWHGSEWLGFHWEQLRLAAWLQGFVSCVQPSGYHTTHLYKTTRLTCTRDYSLLLLSFCQKVSMMPTLQAHCLPGQGWQSAWHDWNSLDRPHGCKVWHLVVLPTRKRGALVRPSQIT